MKKPIILITTSNVNSSALEPVIGDRDIMYSDKASAQAVINAGGLPIYVPTVTTESFSDLEAYVAMADGIFITGADTNTNPLYYGERPTHFKGRIDDERDRVDIELIKMAYERKIPLLGVCKGMQVMAVALGGTLYQDTLLQHPGAFNHDVSKTSRSNFTHVASLTEGSRLRTIFGKETHLLNGGHQQAVKTLPGSLQPVAVADDGVVEAYEGVDYPFLLGVQFHPELRSFDKPFAHIFDEFVAAAAEPAHRPASHPLATR